MCSTRRAIHALDRLVSHARAAGANSVVGVRTNVLHFAGFHEMYMSGTAALHPLLPAETRGAPVTSDLTGEELWGMTQLGYMPIKLLISTSVYSLGAISGIKAAFQSLARGEISDLTTLVYEAREQVFDRVNREAAALGADEVIGIKTYIVELGAGLVEIFAVGTAVRKFQGLGVKTPALPAQAIIRDKDTWGERRRRFRDSDLARGWLMDRPPLPPFTMENRGAQGAHGGGRVEHA